MEMMKLAILGFVLVIPVVGLTVRFALRPLIEAKARAMGGGEAQQRLEQRMNRIEAQVDALEDLRVSMDQLRDELEFNRKLALPPGEATTSSFKA